ncbi:MAG TPA: DinB family protein [Dehalococcoidia bacterium]|nr:DinB family protein [Dehalococcoidia bacterium]
MAEDRESLLEHYRATRRELLAALDGLDEGQATEPSLDGWSVKDHLAHIAFWDDIRTAEVARISAGFESAWPHMDEEQTEVLNSFIHWARQALSLEQVRWELAVSRERLLAAIMSASERGLDDAHYREAALRSTHEAAHAAWIRRWRAERGL